MIPVFPFTVPSAGVNAYTLVDKATSEFLTSPDWRLNIGICDNINSKPWLSKDYIKAVRSRLQHKNPNVELLSLTLLETIMKNCSEHVHVQIAERKILQEMIKIVKKKMHMRVREKILALIDSWQEEFGGRDKVTAQYRRAYEELRRYGVDFPRRSTDTVPVITPPVTRGPHQAGVSSSSHEPVKNISLSSLEPMKNVSGVLSEMLQAVDPKDRKAMKDEVIVDLYNQCRTNQKKLGEILSATTDEEILREGIRVNDTLQHVIEKHDAIASGSPIPAQDGPQVKQPEKKESDPSLAMALVPSDPSPSGDKKTKEDLIDLLSLPSSPTPDPNQTPTGPTGPTGSTFVENQQHVQLNGSYMVPWAQTGPQHGYEPQLPVQTVEEQYYIPPPWAPTPGYYCNPYASNYSTLSYYNNGPADGAGSNPYVPSYRLFDDLNVLGDRK